MLDYFAALPPEVNSARMYTGPGSGPLLAAAAAWNTLAAEMRTAATGYHSVVTQLLSSGWYGPSSTSMLAAATPYLTWLSNAAAQAEQTGTQANAAATAFEAAYAMTVPPPVVTANRTLLANLVATNIFGQNTPAIATTEAEYVEMWAQDAAAMNGYATSSSTASQMTPFQSPNKNTTDDAVDNQTQAVNQALKSSTGNTQSVMQTFSANDVTPQVNAPAAPTSGSLYDYLTQFFGNTNNTAAGQFLSSNFFSNSILNGTIAGGPFNPQTIIGTIQGVMAAQHATILGGLGDFTTDADGAIAAALSSDTVPAAATGGVGQAHLVGSMSVPQSWAGAANISQAPSAVQATGVTGLTDTGAAPSAGGPGGVAGPLGGTGRRLRRAIPKYGFRPVVMPRPPAAG
ncbi:PPE family protein [Mycobacterium rhizamassiliense]|jgi:PPE-repeat protein|uniref:PPE family protein n=1 Tax=Mycobacterium rhizamassiliense TaxID=1841860 RepID=A0A2U3NYZ4_9MYCO|nr:PPE family protein [Mycobacterium rhizamassiliense]SPM36733.1 PPE family protein [Mycobacterium rhizamassiliense]